MADGRRHSVDVPLSRTLVALKRVRSLRDPAANAVCKLAAHVESMNWEMTSCNGAFLGFSNADEHSIVPSSDCPLEGGRDAHGNNCVSDHRLRIANPKVTSSRKSCVLKIKGSKPMRTRLVRACRPVDSKLVPHLANLQEEEVNSCTESNLGSADRANQGVVKKGFGCNRMTIPSTAFEDAAMSRVGSPCVPITKERTNCSSHSSLGLAAEEVDIISSNHSGCGLSNCWLRTPRCTDSNVPSDTEDQVHPLLSSERREISFVQASQYTETPRSLSQKFRPRTFGELVGQNVVAESLLNAILKGKIAPMYLFHGPRGTGKTSTARIFAAALNCLSLQEHRPCGSCRECVFLFSGRSRDVKELAAAKVNRKDRVKALLKSASLVPFSSRFKVFIIDDCECLLGESWATILNSLEDFSRHSVFVMITSDLDKLPRSSMPRCQKYHFQKIKDVDIIFRLQKVCIDEGLDFDSDALEFIAAKSNGSLRDAETMLDQLGLLGKRITLSLAYELVGVVSDDELLDLLDIAFSPDTANTVRRARELMGSRVDPLQLISQLANLIMDILAGRSRLSEVGNNIIGVHDAEDGMQRLRHALKILSETEKQLRTSKNQATWLTVALLQFNSVESLCARTSAFKDDGLVGKTSSRKSITNYVCYLCDRNMSNCSGRYCNTIKLEMIWSRATELCKSASLRSFLKKEGYLACIYVCQGMAVAEVEFCHPNYVSRAEKSRKIVANSLQDVLGCDVDIRFNLLPTYTRKTTKYKKLPLSLLSCSRIKQEVSGSASTDENETRASTERKILFGSYPSHHRQQLSNSSQQSGAITTYNTNCLHHDEAAVATRNMEVDAQSCGTTFSKKSTYDDLPNGHKLETNLLKEVGENNQFIKIQEPEVQPSCFAKTLKLQRKFFLSNVAHTICLGIQTHNKLELSFPKSASFDTYICTDDPNILCSRSNAQVSYSARDNNEPIKEPKLNSKFLCWRDPSTPDRKFGVH